MAEFSDHSLKLSATASSEISAMNFMKSPNHSSVEPRVCLVDSAANNSELIQALNNINIPFVASKDGSEYIDLEDDQYETIFVLEEFDSEYFNNLKHSVHRVLGSPVIMHVALTNEPLPYTYRPQYCSCMQGLNLCFTNFKTKEHLTRLVTTCHYMGACIKKDMSAKIDFLVTNGFHGPKYRTAVSLGIPIMREDWVHLCWNARKRTGIHATHDEFVFPCKAKPFEGCVLSFYGFPAEECEHMKEQALQQGAKTADIGDPSCTHVIVDENNITSLSFEPKGKLFVVVQEWFWGSIQIEARAAESIYIFEMPETKQTMTRSSTCSSLLGTPHKYRKSSCESGVSRASSSSKYSFSRKRSRMKEETLAKLAMDSDPDCGSQPASKRKSTDMTTCMNESLMLDISNNIKTRSSPRQSDSMKDSSNNAVKKAVSARFQVAMEFLQTEKNYVGILNTIINVFKKPLEDLRQAGGPILPGENIKVIFGSLPEIHQVHTRMAADLSNVMETWGDSSCVGCIVDKYAKEFVRCYPPFVNFFEMSKEMIDSCESTMPRFHAFLKINQAKKECGRQTLAELLINPVQRLPRILLLLQDIKKHTERENKNHPDVLGIQTALDAVKEVMTHINEDKRKTESQKQIFDIVYEVEGCPPTIVSSHRQFVTRSELISVDDNLTSKGDHVCLFLFTDCVEIAKRKHGAKTQSFKSPKVHTGIQSTARSLKHIRLLSLSHIKKVVNIKNSDDCQSAFSLFCRTPTDTQDWLYTFKVVTCSSTCGGQVDEKDQEPNATLTGDEGKNRLLQLISRHRANTVCKTSDDNFIHTLSSQDLDISTTDIGSTFGRAFRAAKKSHRKLTRAFSFSRTPRNTVQRAVSTMMSPSMKAVASNNHITPGLGATPSRAWPASKLFEDENGDGSDYHTGSSTSGLTPGMSINSLCTPKRHTRLSSSSSFQAENEENIFTGSQSMMKPSMSMMSLQGPENHYPGILAHTKGHEFQAPTPPVRRKRGAAKAVKAATVALGRAGSFRRKNKRELQ
uniref:protein ECT2-like n=1 Tax=Styela clava TaxID=7725 RepID=UPI00193A68DF|nr:protein ECT2-like [Styela clava]